jgi:hypothetical protein
MSAAQKRAYNLAKTNKSRAKKADKQRLWLDRNVGCRASSADSRYDSKSLPTEDEAVQILVDRGIRSGHIAETVYKLAMTASEMLSLIPNRFYFSNGVEQTLASYVAKSPQPLTEIE